MCLCVARNRSVRGASVGAGGVAVGRPDSPASTGSNRSAGGLNGVNANGTGTKSKSVPAVAMPPQPLAKAAGPVANGDALAVPVSSPSNRPLPPLPPGKAQQLGLVPLQPPQNGTLQQPNGLAVLAVPGGAVTGAGGFGMNSDVLSTHNSFRLAMANSYGTAAAH